METSTLLVICLAGICSFLIIIRLIIKNKKIDKRWREYKCNNGIHDYSDDAIMNTPSHFYIYTCKHCKQHFTI